MKAFVRSLKNKIEFGVLNISVKQTNLCELLVDCICIGDDVGASTKFKCNTFSHDAWLEREIQSLY